MREDIRIIYCFSEGKKTIVRVDESVKKTLYDYLINNFNIKF